MFLGVVFLVFVLFGIQGPSWSYSWISCHFRKLICHYLFKLFVAFFISSPSGIPITNILDHFGISISLTCNLFSISIFSFPLCLNLDIFFWVTFQFINSLFKCVWLAIKFTYGLLISVTILLSSRMSVWFLYSLQIFAEVLHLIIEFLTFLNHSCLKFTLSHEIQAIANNKPLRTATIQVNFRNIMLSERSQAQKSTYCTSQGMWNLIM